VWFGAVRGHWKSTILYSACDFLLAILPLDIAYLYTKFDDFIYSFSRSRDIIGAPKIKMNHVTWPVPFRGHWFVIRGLGLATINLYLSNLNSLSPFITKLWKAIQNVKSSKRGGLQQSWVTGKAPFYTAHIGSHWELWENSLHSYSLPCVSIRFCY